MAVYFLDNDQHVIKIVPDNGAISILQTQELPEDSNLLKDVLSVHLKNDERLFDAQYMAIKSYDGNRNSFDMYRIVNELVPDNATEYEGVQVAPYELEGVVVEDLRPQGWTIERTTNQILKDSDWRLGYVDDNLPTVTTNFYYLSAKDSLKKLQELTGVEFTFKVEISGNKITDKWVEVYRELGNRTLKRFNYGTNALTVKRETNHSELYTALIGRGKGEEVGETDAGDATYGRKINFSDVEWKKSAGKPVDKPKGQKYIELPQVTAEYGIKLLDGRKVPRIGLVEFSDTEDPEVLIEQTWQALQEYERPKVLFSATVANIGDTGIGDTVTIHRHDLNMHYKTRVRKVMRNRKNNDKTQVEIGDVVYTASTKQQANINSQLNNMQNDLSNVKGEVSHVVTSADGKNNITYSNIEPERKKIGDSWVRDHPSLAGETQWLVWNGEAWELILDTSETTLNKEAIEQAQQDIKQAQATADEAVNQIDTAVANAGFTSLDETISSVQTISNQAQINAGTAIDNALEAMQQASVAVENTGSLNVRVDDVENTLSVKADKQAVDDLTGVVDLQALDIQANAQGLALKANQDTVDLIDGRVSSLGTEVNAVAGQISSKVWNMDIETAIDGLEYENRNLALGDSPINPDKNYFATNGGRPVKFDPNYEGFYTEAHQGRRFENLSAGSYTISLEARRRDSGTSIYTILTTNMGARLMIPPSDLTDNWQVFKQTFEVKKGEENLKRELVFYNSLFWRKIKLEKGTKATDWTPAPEDTDAKIEHIETEFTQKYDSITSTVSSLDGRVAIVRQDLDSITRTVSDNTGKIANQQLTINGLQTEVFDPETGLTSVNTQLANLVNIAVTGDELSGALSVMEDNLNLRLVKKDEIITQINLSEENILLQANKIQALGDVVVDGKLTITDEFIAPNAQIDGAKIADATIGSAKIANLDASKITTGKIEGIEMNFKLGRLGGWYVRDGRMDYNTKDNEWTVFKPTGEVALAMGVPTSDVGVETSGATMQLFHDGKVLFNSDNGLRLGGLRRHNEEFTRVGMGSTKYTEISSEYKLFVGERSERTNGLLVTGHGTDMLTGTVLGTDLGGSNEKKIELIHSSSALNIYSKRDIEISAAGTSRVRTRGDVVPQNSNAYHLGTGTYLWATVQGVSIREGSDARLKNDIDSISDDFIEHFAENVQPKTYKINGKRNFGYIAQDVERALFKFERKLDATALGIKTLVGKYNIVSTDDEGMLTLSYSQIEALKGAYRDRKIEELENRIKELENES